MTWKRVEPKGLMKDNIVLESDIFQVTIIPESDSWRPSSRRQRARVYVDDEVIDSLSDAYVYRALRDAEKQLDNERRWSKRDLFPEVDRLYDALNREIARLKRTIALVIVTRLVNTQHIEPLSGKAKVRGTFSRKAGCSCGCSPGVILDDAYRTPYTPAYKLVYHISISLKEGVQNVGEVPRVD